MERVGVGLAGLSFMARAIALSRPERWGPKTPGWILPPWVCTRKKHGKIAGRQKSAENVAGQSRILTDWQNRLLRFL